MSAAFPYVWTWRQRTVPLSRAKTAWFGDGIDRTGQRCRVVCRSTMNSVWLVFEDGYQVVTSRYGLRKPTSERN